MKNIIVLLALVLGGLPSPALLRAQTPSDKQLEAIEKIMAPQRKKVTDLLEADKTGQYKSYQADLAALATEKDPARAAELFAKLERDHLAFIRQAYAAARINNADLKRQVAQILGTIKFSFGEFADIQIDFIPPALVAPLRFDTELLCPMEILDQSDAGQVAAECVAQAFDCSMSVQSLAEIAGGCRGKTSTGNEFVLPDGPYSSITVLAQSDIRYKGFAVAVGGYGQINAKFGVRFQAPGLDKVVMAKEVFALAPVIWLSRIEGKFDNFKAQAAFSGSFAAGSTITAQVYSEAFALSVPLLSLTHISASTLNVDFIRISGSE